MAAVQGGPSAGRGGWSTTIITENLMKDPREQPSLSQGLLLGVGKAHRRQVHGGPEFRNYRRSSYFDVHGHRHQGAKNFAGEDDGYETQATKTAGVPLDQQLADEYRRRGFAAADTRGVGQLGSGSGDERSPAGRSLLSVAQEMRQRRGR
jgi:hypothetical protein